MSGAIAKLPKPALRGALIKQVGSIEQNLPQPFLMVLIGLPGTISVTAMLSSDFKSAAHIFLKLMSPIFILSNLEQ